MNSESISHNSNIRQLVRFHDNNFFEYEYVECAQRQNLNAIEAKKK